MKEKLILLAASAVVVVGSLLWWFSDAQVIKRQTKALAESLEVSSTAGKAIRLGKTQDFVGFLAQSASGSVDFEDYQSEYRRDDLEMAHHMLMHNCKWSRVTIIEMSLDFISKDKATVTGTLELAVADPSGSTYQESAEAKLSWQKNTQGKWRLDSIHMQTNK